MAEGTIVFVHGTGVRLRAYREGFDIAKKCAAASGIEANFVECAWGDPLGVEFDGKSLPGPLSKKQLEDQEQDFARWRWLLDDPLSELDKLIIRDTSQVKKTNIPPGRKPAWMELWNKIAAYQASPELNLLLDREGLSRFWPEAWSQILLLSPLPKLAFERSAHELPDVSSALAHALVAQLHLVALDHERPGPGAVVPEHQPSE